MLTVKQYGDLALCTWGKVGKVPRKLSAAELQLNAVLGLVGETGEIVELLKKARFHDKPYAPADFRAELGDALYYLVVGATAFGFPVAYLLDGATWTMAWAPEKRWHTTAHPIECALQMAAAAGRLSDLVAGKEQGLGGVPPVVFRDILKDFGEALAELVLTKDWILWEIAFENIAKLGQRYPENFANSDAYAQLVEQQMQQWQKEMQP